MAPKERKFKRVRPSTEIKVLSLNGIIMIGRLLDLSLGGAKIGLDIHTHYKAGNEVNIAFMLNDERNNRIGPVFARGKVAWQRVFPASSEIGLSFEEILPSHLKRIQEFTGSA
jgi:hypothetical protein